MTVERKDIGQMETARLFDIAEDKQFFLERLWAMEELAERAVSDKSLLERLLKVVGKNIATRGRNGTPLGLSAAWKLVDNLDDDIIEQLAVSATDWSVWDQLDFFNRCFDQKQRQQTFNRMTERGMQPKIWLTEQGDAEPLSAFVGTVIGTGLEMG